MDFKGREDSILKASLLLPGSGPALSMLQSVIADEWQNSNHHSKTGAPLNTWRMEVLQQKDIEALCV